jgi:ankyrin repeat protein
LCQNYKNENLIDIVQLFIENGIDVNWKNRAGWNALLFLCKNYVNDNLIEIVRLLIEHGININHTAYEGNAFHLLCKYYQNENLIDILQLLITNGITVRRNVFDPRILIRKNPNQTNNESVIQLLDNLF